MKTMFVRVSAMTLMFAGLGVCSEAHAQGTLGSYTSLYPDASTQQTLSAQTEDNLKQVFVISGYSAAFGAALGAAFLPFLPPSLSNVRYVLGGASLGFVFGAGYGFYALSQNPRSPSPQQYDYGVSGYSSAPLSPAEHRLYRQASEHVQAPGVSLPAYRMHW